ncbi:MAG TPA: TonB-dependent receptor [Nevskiaceae bacterium]|nr:TonB-dependent receptor [Nevskiaceae bacterium]
MKRVPHRRQRDGLLAAALVLAGLAPVAHAQSGGGTQLQTVIVTSEKSAQPIQQVPASVSTLSGAAIKNSGSINFAQLSDYIPNVTISLSPDSGQFAVRGFATPDTNPGFDPSVGTVVDGVFYGRPQFLSAFFYDIGHFEVLRGPQGTLFGKNVTAGLVDLDTAEPRNQFLLRSEYLMSSDGDRSFRPVLQLPLGDKLSVRFAGNIEHGDRGVLYNTFLHRGERDINQSSGRFRLRYTPTDALTVDLEGFVSTQNRHNNIFKLTKVTPDMAALFRKYDPNIEFGLDNNKNSANYPSENVDDTRGGALNVAYDTAPPWAKTGLTLRSITGFAQARVDRRDIDADFSPVAFVTDTLPDPSPYRQFSQEFRINGRAPDLFDFGHKLTYVAGLYYSRSVFDMTNQFSIQNLGQTLQYLLAANPSVSLRGLPVVGPIVTGIPVLGPFLNDTINDVLSGAANGLGSVASGLLGPQNAVSALHQVDSSYAVYGQAHWFVIPHWAVIAGLRVGLEHKSGTASSESSSQLIKSIAGQDNFAQNISDLDRDLSPKLGIQWSPDERTSAYLTWARGYKSGGFNANALNADSLSFSQERADSYELGFKTLASVWKTPLRLSADVFWTNFHNLQESTLENGSNFITFNAGSARSRGFETDLEWLPFKHASLHFASGFADATYTANPNAGTSGPDLTGRPLPFAPRWTLALTPGYTVMLPKQVAAHAFFDVLYKSGRYLDIDDDRANKYQGGVTTLNARIVFNDPSHLWSVGLVAHNITHRVIIDQVIDEPEAPGNYAAVRIDRGLYYTADFTFSFR